MGEKTNAFAIALFGILFSASIISSAFLITDALYKVKNLDNILSVTGSTRYAVTADTVKWSSNISRSVKASDLKSGYSQISKDLDNVIKFLKDNGIKESDIKTYPVSMEKDWSYNQNVSPNDQIYLLRQNIEVSSTDVNSVENISKNTEKISNINAFFSMGNVEYYYSKLPELRVNLLSDAIKDAKNRASKIAESNNQKVGSLKSATMGSVLVLAPNSNIDNTDWGAYDTLSKEKEIMVTVKTSFLLE